MMNAPFSTGASIFRTPLVAKKTDDEARVLQMKAKNDRLAKGILVAAIGLLAAYSFYFFYPQATAFIEAPATLAQMQGDIKRYDEVNLPGLAQSRDLKQAAYEEQLNQIDRNINTIFPDEIDKLGLVKRLENFATAIDSKNPPFEFNGITFEKPVKDQAYTILPITTSIHSSRANFDRFIQLIDLSGRPESDIPIRLMEISNVSIRYRGSDPQTGQDNGVDFTVKLNAYSR